MAEIIEKELSYVLNGCIFDVHNEVGPGLREECYQKAMEIRLAQAGIRFESKPKTRRELTWFGEVADVFEPDFDVANRVLLELKVHPEGLPQSAFRQTINYLKFWRYELGLLINFAEAKAEIRRVIYHDAKAEAQENFDFVRGQISGAIREKLIAVREVILRVHREFGLGSSDATYRRLLTIGLRHSGLKCDTDVIAQPEFRQRRLPQSPITPLLIDDTVLLQVEAICDGIPLRAIRTMQTHLQCMNLEAGVITSFGQSQFELRGVRARETHESPV